MKIFGVLLSVFIVVPVVEFALLIEIGRRIGTLDTLLLVFGTGLLGAYLARLEGFRILWNIRRDLDQGRAPTEGLFDGFLVLAAGILLITPGLLTDVAGLLALFPLTRKPLKAILRRQLERYLARSRVQIVPY